MVLPPEPPELTPGAARALLRILVKANGQQAEATGTVEDLDLDHAERQLRTSRTDTLDASAPSTTGERRLQRAGILKFQVIGEKL